MRTIEVYEVQSCVDCIVNHYKNTRIELPMHLMGTYFDPEYVECLEKFRAAYEDYLKAMYEKHGRLF